MMRWTTEPGALTRAARGTVHNPSVVLGSQPNR